MITVPPIKCQGIKTKLVPAIRACLVDPVNGRWIEPFCGSGVVALNVLPERAILADTNRYIIGLYQAIQSGEITPPMVRSFLEQEGETLSKRGADYYYEVRSRFNVQASSLDFLL